MDRHDAQIATLTQDLAQAKGDIRGIGNAVKTILARAGGAPAAGSEEPKGQPEWLGCADAEEAQAILLAVDEWLDRFGRLLGVDVEQCWPWHPEVVALLLAASQHHGEVYRGKAADKVSDFMIRVRPMVIKQVRQELAAAGCNEHEHKEPSGARYTVRLEQVTELAAWWATDRSGLSPGLSSRLGATG